jgi:hypothetical protein
VKPLLDERTTRMDAGRQAASSLHRGPAGQAPPGQPQPGASAEEGEPI